MVNKLSRGDYSKFISVVFVTMITVYALLFASQQRMSLNEPGIIKGYKGTRVSFATATKSNTMVLSLLNANNMRESSDFRYDVIDDSFRVAYSYAAITQEADAIYARALENIQLVPGYCERRLPQCLITGNFKCGTRELIDFMSMHPKIKITTTPRYETKFFSADIRYNRGLNWYKKQMPCSYENQITVEKSPEYFQISKCASRIKEMNSSIKLIVMVREPVSRTMSHFTFFPEYSVYKLEDAIFNQTTGKIKTYVTVTRFSIYDLGMKEYLRFFNRSQIKVIDSEDFNRDPYIILHELETFLNLEHTIRPDNFVFNKEKGFFCLRQNKNSKTASCYHEDRGRNKSDVGQAVTPEILKKLQDYFKPHNERFFKLIGHRFDW